MSEHIKLFGRKARWLDEKSGKELIGTIVGCDQWKGRQQGDWIVLRLDEAVIPDEWVRVLLDKLTIL